jgi:CDP-glucose 4,6-dehydratase
MQSKEELAGPFSGSTVLVAGHTGFKGAWLCFMLNALGAKVVGYSHKTPPQQEHCYHALGIKDLVVNAETAVGDVRDIDRYRTLIDTHRPDFVFHLAAQAIVATSYKEPLETFSTNCMGVANILEILRLTNRPTTAIVVTSDKCYKNKERMEPYREDEEMGGDDPYSASKGAAELIFQSYLTSFLRASDLIKIASVRAGNVFGGGDWSPNRLIPDCMRDLMDTGKVRIRMPEAVRPWTFVIDILYGYLMLAQRLHSDPEKYKGSWNFASGETRTVRNICNTMINQVQGATIEVSPSIGIGKESGLLLIDAAKVRAELGWRPRYNLDQALRDTCEWYLRQRDGTNMQTYSRNYLDAYFDETR